MGDLAQRIHHRLAKVPNLKKLGRSDFDLNPDMKGRVKRPETLRDAAVLVPIIERARKLTVLLMRRAEELPSHAGQISFPGGRHHHEDEDLLATALRETQEEVGIAADRITVAGYLDRYETGTGYYILPVVGLLGGDVDLILDSREVADVFEVPLAFLMDPANHKHHTFVRDGVKRYFYAMPYEDHYIWGATAGMLKMLYDRLYGP
jgi:8-oxo-dGTP pyrophosphatase MutT (NUDIX family)